MSALRRAIATLAEEFANQVVAALRSASFGDIAALSGNTPVRRGPGRPPKNAAAASPAPATRGRRGGRRRRTNADLEALGGRIVETVRGSANGMRAEAIRDALGVARKELPRAISQLLATGALKKQGQRRATTYFAGDGNAPRGGAKKAGKRAGKRRGKKAA
jgi:hypothetical protein